MVSLENDREIRMTGEGESCVGVGEGEIGMEMCRRK